MKSFLVLLVFLLAATLDSPEAPFMAPVEAAPTLSWDTVTTATDGSTLGPGLEVKSYRVYRCAVNVNPCTKLAGTAIGTVPAAVPLVPNQSFDLAGQSFPSVYIVTATNIIAESAESDSIKATPADRPKNPRLSKLGLTRCDDERSCSSDSPRSLERLMLAHRGHKER